MNFESFVYWLQGFMELADPIELDSTQVEIIKDHLNLVLGKVTPDRRMFQIDLDEAMTAEAVRDLLDPNKDHHRFGWGTGLDNVKACSAQTDLRTISLC